MNHKMPIPEMFLFEKNWALPAAAQKPNKAGRVFAPIFYALQWLDNKRISTPAPNANARLKLKILVLNLNWFILSIKIINLNES